MLTELRSLLVNAAALAHLVAPTLTPVEALARAQCLTPEEVASPEAQALLRPLCQQPDPLLDPHVAPEVALRRTLQLLHLTPQGNRVLVSHSQFTRWLTVWPAWLLAAHGVVWELPTWHLLTYPFDRSFHLNETLQTREDRLQGVPEITLRLAGVPCSFYLDEHGSPHLISRTALVGEEVDARTRCLLTCYPGALAHLTQHARTYTFMFEYLMVPGEPATLVLVGMRELASGRLLRHAELTQHATALTIPVVPLVRSTLAGLLAKRYTVQAKGWLLLYPDDLLVKVATVYHTRLVMLTRHFSHRKAFFLIRDSLDVEQLLGLQPHERAHLQPWFDDIHAAAAPLNALIEAARSLPLPATRREVVDYLQARYGGYTSLVISALNGNFQGVEYRMSWRLFKERLLTPYLALRALGAITPTTSCYRNMAH